MTTDANNPGRESESRLSSGIPGLDKVLHGGLMPGRSTLVRGPPGAGKTLFGLHFLAEGIENDDTTLYINFGEPEEYLRQDVETFGFDFALMEFLDLAPSGDEFTNEATYDIFSASEVEGTTIASEIADTIDSVDPDRAVVDPATQLRYIANDAHQFRQQMIAMLRMLREQGATTLFSSQKTEAAADDDMQFLSDAVINLGYDDEQRFIQVTKFRGSDFQSGRHSVQISDEGIACSPKLVPELHDREFTAESISSGIPELDELLFGGIERGTVTFLSGPTGVGKTTTGLQFMKEAAGRGENSVLYSFEEATETLLHRASAVNIPIVEMLDGETLRIDEIKPFDITVDQFAQRVRRDVEERDAEIVMIDGTDGYRRSLRGLEGDGIDELQRIGRYLKNMGVTVILVNEVHEITGDFKVTEYGASYLADNIVFLRHIEHRGELRKVIGVLKKRTSDYEKRLRQLEITEHGLKVGDPLPELRGLLTGTPEWRDSTNPESHEGE